MSKRVAILSASVGAGHLRAAAALEESSHDAPLKVKNLDVLQFTPKAFQTLYRDAYFDLVAKAPEMLGWLYDQTDKPFEEDVLRLLFERANCGKFLDKIDEIEPDLALCTHFLPADLLAIRRRRGKFAGKIIKVVTDFDVHGMWLGTPADHYFVAVPEAKAYLESFGVDPDLVTVSGIPTDPVFGELKQRDAMAEKHGLRSDLPTVLISTGGFGVTNVESILDALYRVKAPIQVVVMCGRNEKLKAGLESWLARQPQREYPVVRAQGFTTEMDEFMTAADMVLGKPGGLTSWESFMKGLAWVVVNPIPGQEERNTFHMLEEGIGLWAYEPRTLAYKLDQVLSDTARLTRMKANSRRMARPDAGHVIWQKAFEMLEL